ncbi:MFS transporter [Paenibacillaceae bacterium]|nr:MFS transporter [Paenibacillaceae bacterium]
MKKVMPYETASYQFNGRKAIPWILFIMFFGVLNETVFNLSTPKVADQYDLSPAGVSWIITVFVITFSIGTVVYGKLADMFSIRSLITSGLFIYALGAVVGFFLQHWYVAILIGRAIQGVGASAIPALIMVVAARYYKAADRSKLFGVLASTSSFAIGIGPVIGGIVSAYIHWSTLFLLSFFPLLSIRYFRRAFPVEARRTGNLDITGLLMLSISVSAFVFWCTNPSMWWLILLGIVALFAFIWRIRTAANPFVQPELFKSWSYCAGLVTGMLLFVVMAGIPFILPLFLSGVHAFDTDRIGFMLFPGTMSAVVFGTIAGRLTASKGANYVTYIGLLVVAAALLGVVVMMTQWIGITVMLIPLYIGFAFVQTGLWDKMAQVIPPEMMGVGMGFFTLAAQIFGAFGTAGIAQMMDHHWLSRPIIPLLDQGASTSYGNLFIGFSALMIIAWMLFYKTFAGKGRPVLHKRK